MADYTTETTTQYQMLLSNGMSLTIDHKMDTVVIKTYWADGDVADEMEFAITYQTADTLEAMFNAIYRAEIAKCTG